MGDRRQDRPHARRRLRARRLGEAQGGRPDLGRARRAEREPRDAESLELLEYGFSLLPGPRPCGPARWSQRPQIRYAGRRAAAARRAPVTVGVRKGQRVATGSRPDEVAGPIRRGRRLGTPSRSTAGTPAGARCRPARDPRGDHLREGQVASAAGRRVDCRRPGSRYWSSLVAAAAVAAAEAVNQEEMRSSREMRRDERAAPRTARRAPVIITVTLNAAIDRTVAVPNFRQGNRHRAVESRTVAGARASTSRGRWRGSASR